MMSTTEGFYTRHLTLAVDGYSRQTPHQAESLAVPRDAVAGAERKISEAHRNTELSPAGQATRAQGAIEQAHAVLDRFDQETAALEQRMSEKQQRALRIPAQSTTPEALSLERLIWDRALAGPAQSGRTMYLAALESGDDVTAAAIERLPMSLAFIDAATARAAREIKAARLPAEEREALATLDQAASVRRLISDQARRALVELRRAIESSRA